VAVVDATLLTACGAENYGTERRWLSVAGIGESGTLWALSERDACNATGRRGRLAWNLFSQRCLFLFRACSFSFSSTLLTTST